MDDNSWNSWSKHVLKELERLSESYQDMQKELQKVSLEISLLKFKNTFWGAIGGAIPVALYFLFEYSTK